jgi:hypothetical protein
MEGVQEMVHDLTRLIDSVSAGALTMDGHENISRNQKTMIDSQDRRQNDLLRGPHGRLTGSERRGVSDLGRWYTAPRH